MLPKFSVRKPLTVFVAVVITLVLGILSFQNMSTDFLPSMELPYALVMTTYPGASPEEVERAVSQPVEQSMARINNVKRLQSISINNMSIVMMEFNDGTDMGSTTIDMRESLDMVTASWDESIGSPTIMKMNPDMMPIMVAALDYEDLDSTEVTKRAKQDIIPELESVEGVASVTEAGVIEKNIQVIIQQKKLDEMNQKVQDAIEGKLQDAQDKIDKGKKKLENGKDKLNNGKEKAADQIAKGETKLISASDQIKDGLKAIDENIAKINEQKKTLDESSKQIKTGLASLRANKTKLQSTIKTLTRTKTQLENLQNALNDMIGKEAALQKQISELGDAATNEMKTSLTALQTQLQVMRNQLTQFGVTESELPEKIQEVSQGLTEAKKGLAEIEKQEPSLVANQKKVTTAQKKIASGLKKLNATRKKLQQGKISTTAAFEKLNKQKILSSIQMSVAEAQMNSGKTELNNASKQFKDTKKATKENADLTKIITKEMVENILKAENFDMPSGYITEEDASYLVRVGLNPKRIFGI